MATAAPAQASILDQKLKDSPPAKWGFGVFALVLVGGLIYIVTRLSIDLSPIHQASVFPYVLLGVALLIALVSSSSMVFMTPRMPSQPSFTLTLLSRTSLLCGLVCGTSSEC